MTDRTYIDSVANIVAEAEPAFAEYIRQYNTAKPEPAEPKPHPLEGLPAGTQIYVDKTGTEFLRYFYGIDDGVIITTSSMLPGLVPVSNWPNCTRIAENEPRPWFGGECPVPGWVKVKVWLRDSTVDEELASQYRWNHNRLEYAGFDVDIIAYQILEQEVPQ